MSDSPSNNQNKTELLFSLNRLPSDIELLKELRRRINSKLGENSLDLNQAIVENLEMAVKLRNRLCGVGQINEEPDYNKSAGDEPAYYPEEIKETAKISSVVACSSIITNIVKMQEVIHSQQANALLQDAIIEVLANFDDDLKEKVVELFKEKVKELEKTIK